MGCSPSKGKLFSKPEGPGPHKALLAEPSQDTVDSGSIEEVKKCLEADQKDGELPLSTENHSSNDTAELVCDTSNPKDIKETRDNVIPKEFVSEVAQKNKVKKIEKRKKIKSKRRSTEKQRKSSIIQTKFDLPPHMVRAHQAAYDFLNPNISKYETLLGLLDNAAQTHLSLQPMMSALVLCFEEINQALEEMAEEGELMLKEHGDYMALPSGMMAVMSAKRSTDITNTPDPSPDLLQQLLQHSTEKMKLVGGSVKTLGDTTLGEAVEYFSSLSKLLVEKLQAKQAAERRLALVLAQVEGAAMMKSNPEDSALHSEDSGIGGENESLTGSERHRRHRRSSGSGSCGSGVNIRSAFDSLPNIVPSLIGYNEDDEEYEEGEEEEEEEDEDEEYEEDEGDRHGRKRSNSSPPDPSQPLLYMYVNDKQDRQPTVKRPLTAITATRPEHPSSSQCVNLIMELQKSQKDLDLRMKKMAEMQGNEASGGLRYNLYRAGLRRHSLSGSAGGRGPLRTNQPPYCLPTLAPHTPKRPSVRRLINTFSQGVDGRPGQSLANFPPHIRRPRKSGILLLSDTGNNNERSSVINGNNNNNSWPDGKDDLDVDNLPPPPPEVLMDNSFRSTEDIPGNEEGSQEGSVQTLPMINQRVGVSQRLRASVQNVEVLPNRASVRPKSISISPAHPVGQDAVMRAQDTEQQPETDLDPDMEKANCLYQQARKIIHLRNAAESIDKRKNAELSGQGPLALQARMGQRCESNEFSEGDMSSCSLPVTTPPVSRVRLPPSCPTVRHRFPSPPVCRPQSTSKHSSRPNSPRTVTRATDNNTEVFVPSVSFHDARSVFCQNDTQICLSSGSSVPPRPWGEVSRGRLPMRGMDNSTRRTQSEQRPCMTSYAEFSRDGSSASTQSRGSDTDSKPYRAGSPLMSGDNTQLDLDAAVMKA